MTQTLVGCREGGESSDWKLGGPGEEARGRNPICSGPALGADSPEARTTWSSSHCPEQVYISAQRKPLRPLPSGTPVVSDPGLSAFFYYITSLSRKLHQPL